MKFTGLASLAALASAVAGSPTRSVVKRAALGDACDVGYCLQNGGTTGGAGGTTTTVSTLAQFTAAAESTTKMVIVVKGAITGAAKVRVKSDKTIIGASGSSLTGVGLYINKQKNVIVRNMKISKVKASNGDAIGIQASTNVWVDHCDLSSDTTSGKDFYDGLLDITHAAEFITVSNTFLHDHFKASLVGHSDSNSAQDTGALHITYANNYFKNINSRAPSVRFGTVHIFNGLYENIGATGINTRMGAEVLVESTTFSGAKKAITSVDSKTTGSAVTNDVNLGGSTNDAPAGKLSASSLGYKYTLLGAAKVKASVSASAGQTLSF